LADDSFDAFYRGSRGRVVTFLYAINGDLGEAQDAAQEAYARAWQRWRTVESYADPEAWVRAVGYRLLLNRWRKIRNGLTAYRRHGPAAAADPPSADRVALVSALGRLPVEQRRVVVLFHLLDLPLTAVAEQTGLPVNTVKSHLSRGRRALAQVLGAEVWNA
jgi:RNA polymerase sigma-70 factor (ECF subfamily)